MKLSYVLGVHSPEGKSPGGIKTACQEEQSPEGLATLATGWRREKFSGPIRILAPFESAPIFLAQSFTTALTVLNVSPW